ncbi:MAG: hypothetical protein ACOC80_16550 [Petrotogales bacterium]
MSWIKEYNRPAGHPRKVIVFTNYENVHILTHDENGWEDCSNIFEPNEKILYWIDKPI